MEHCDHYNFAHVTNPGGGLLHYTNVPWGHPTLMGTTVVLPTFKPSTASTTYRSCSPEAMQVSNVTVTLTCEYVARENSKFFMINLL